MGSSIPRTHWRVLGAFTQFFCGLRRTEGQDLSETPLVGNRLRKGNDCLSAPPFGLDAARLFIRENPIFIALDRPGNRCPDRYGVEPVAIAQVIALDDRFYVVVEGHTAEGGQGLVFRPVRLVDRPLSVRDFVVGSTSERALGAGVLLRVVLLVKSIG